MSHKTNQRAVDRKVVGRGRRTRIIAYSVIALGIALGAVLLALRPWLRNGSQSGGTVSAAVRVQADMGGFRPAVIRARAGEPIRVRLESLDNRFHLDGGGRHQFAIDQLGVNLVAPPLGAAETTFVPLRAGVYRYYCSICCGGRANPAMWGELIVSS